MTFHTEYMKFKRKVSKKISISKNKKDNYHVCIEKCHMNQFHYKVSYLNKPEDLSSVKKTHTYSQLFVVINS